MANLELRRILAEWRMRLDRAKDILTPQQWNESDWKVFACSLAVLVQKHGAHWQADGKRFWDLRWKVREGGELICQVEQQGQESVGVVVAQSGGWAGDNTYTWMWTEFTPQGDYLREPYWVDGMWKEALVALMLPYSMRAGFMLAERAETPEMAQRLGSGEKSD